MKILLLTSVYPSATDVNNKYTTKVVEYFAREWEKTGHEVIVIHNKNRFPAVVYLLPEKFRLMLTAKLNFLISPYSDVQEKSWCDGGIRIFRLPIKKYIPHGKFSSIVIEKQTARIVDILEREQFMPDVIMGHWLNPQIQIIDELKKIYNCPTSLVIHGKENFKVLSHKNYLEGIDALGCRSRTDVEYVRNTIDFPKEPFVCYSGVPDSFVKSFSCNSSKFSEKPTTWRFVFVGRLIAYKNIDKTLMALSKIKNQNYTFDIIGTGYEKANLEKLAKELGIEEKVYFHGQLPREKVLEMLQESHAFIMISKGEVYGLVYLEAMVASCIAIGSKDEGIDGVIKHKKNGLLCKAADANDLTDILNELMTSDEKTLQSYVECGYETATQFTDSNVANRYLYDAFGFGKK